MTVELWLYGSRARGDADWHSDTDVLAVGDRDAEMDAAIAQLGFPRVSLSFYSWDEVEAMRSYGSLFLHHVAREGKRLRASTTCPERLPSLLASLPPFSRAREDLAGFRLTVAESRTSLADGGWPHFECEVVSTVARHAAILGSYCVGEAAFERERPFRVTGRALGYSARQIDALAFTATAWRFEQAGRHTEPKAVEAWLNLVERFLHDLQQVIDDYTAVLQQAA